MSLSPCIAESATRLLIDMLRCTRDERGFQMRSEHLGRMAKW